jgi:membrane-associated phospholipid phosphatase
MAMPPDLRFGIRAAAAGLALTLVTLPFGLLLLLVRGRWDPLLDLDQGASDALHGFALDHDGFVTVLKVISTIGSAYVYVPLFTAVAIWLFTRGLRRLAAFVAVTEIGSAIINGLVKGAVDRARPVLPDPVAHAGGYSFPSGHAQNATVAAGVLLLVFLPTLRGRARTAALIAAPTWVVLVCFSRVGLGVHFVSDVVAGVILGVAWVAATTALFSAWRRESGRPPVEPEKGLEPEAAARLG